MNAFVEHHQQAIRFVYSCFDRILLNGVIQVLQNPACVVGFLKEKRQADRVTPDYFRAISTDYHHFVQALAAQHHVDILIPPPGVRREEWSSPIMNSCRAKPASPSSSRSARTPAWPSVPRQGSRRASTGSSNSTTSIQDQTSGGCSCDLPYFPSAPVSASMATNGWPAGSARRASSSSKRQCLRTCAARAATALADFLDRGHRACGHRTAGPTRPFFTDRETPSPGFGHRLFVSQVEYCTNQTSTPRWAACW